MIDLHELSSDESFDSTMSCNVSHSSSKPFAPIDQDLSNNVTYNTSNIKNFLKEQPEKYTLVGNVKVNHMKPSPCWKKFALPAVKDENNRNIIIKNFATCRSCFTTYCYTRGSTKSLNVHKCSKELSSISSCTSTRYVDYYLFHDIFFVFLVLIHHLLIQKIIDLRLRKKKL